MRRLLLLAAVSSLALCSSASAAPAFYVWGKGWGHGIGMPQWGAYGYALRGWTHTEILDHFYRGTEPGTAAKKRIRVLLDVGRSSVTLSSPSRWTIADGKGRSWQVPAGARTVGASLRVRINGKVRRLAPPVTFKRANGKPLTVDGNAFRGSIVLRKPTSLLSVVNHLGFQPYLFGVVPWEMPASWHPEALKAQAVAARSYGLSSLTMGSYFDVYDDTRDQVYGGVRAEEPSTNAAVQATANEIRTYDGRLAQTFFYSSSGGWTAANEDVWGSAPLPYLRSVRDRWDTMSPHHTWGPFRYSRAAMDAKLGGHVSGRLKDMVVDVNPSRRADSVAIRGTGGTTSARGDTLRWVLGLKSSWFRVGVLKLTLGRAEIKRGSTVRLRGLARSVGDAWLEKRRPGGAWEKLRDLELTSKSRFSTRVKPRGNREYRVASRRGASEARLVRVSAEVLFYEPTDRTELAGIVRPSRSGVAVTVERRDDGDWQRVKTGRTDSSGGFAIPLELTNGAYRAVAGVPGLARGTSPTLRIVG